MPISFVTQEEFNALAIRVAELEARPAVSGSSDPVIWHKNSGDSSERVISIPLGYPAGTQSRIVFSIPLPDLYPGDVVEMHGSYEVTNPYNYNALSGRYLAINNASDHEIDVAAYVSEAATENVTPNQHHGIVQDKGSFTVTEEMTGKHAVMIGYGAASLAALSHRFTVHKDYGRLYVKIYRAAIMEQAE